MAMLKQNCLHTHGIRFMIYGIQEGLENSLNSIYLNVYTVLEPMNTVLVAFWKDIMDVGVEKHLEPTWN